MNNKYAYVILALSILNWFPIMIFVFVYPPVPLLLLLLFMSLFSPLFAMGCIAAITALMFTRLSKIGLGSIIIAVNILYLLWSKNYLDMIGSV